jgi:AcrR family transcriptional regulator
MSTRDEICRACGQELLGRTETEFRVTAVAKSAGCATSVLYHYFDSRDRLVDAGFGALVDAASEAHEAEAHELFEIADRATDFAAFLGAFLAFSSRAERRDVRALRARLLGASQTRPEVRAHFAAYGERVAATHRAILRRLQDRGQLRTDVDVAALALVLRVLEDGWVVAEVDLVAPAPLPAWAELGRILGRGLTPDEAHLDVSAD